MNDGQVKESTVVRELKWCVNELLRVAFDSAEFDLVNLTLIIASSELLVLKYVNQDVVEALELLKSSVIPVQASRPDLLIYRVVATLVVPV